MIHALDIGLILDVVFFINYYNAGTDMSRQDLVCRRQILTIKDDPRAVRVENICKLCNDHRPIIYCRVGIQMNRKKLTSTYDYFKLKKTLLSRWFIQRFKG